MLILAAVAAAVVLARLAAGALARTRTQRAAARAPDLWPLLGAHPDGRPTVVSFSTKACTDCRVQAIILGDVLPPRLINVDAADQPQVASAFGVLTAPTTAVLGADGSLIAVNHGLAPADRLRRQLEAARSGLEAEVASR